MAEVRWRRWLAVPAIPAALLGLGVLGCVGVCVGFPCVTTGLRYGVWLDECPVGDLRLGAEVTASGVVRGDEGQIYVRPYFRHLIGEGGGAYPVEETMYRGASVSLKLEDADGKEVPGFDVSKTEWESGSEYFTVKLPAIGDGDYQVVAHVEAPFETTDVTLPLALYAPAIAHVMTDRPLYKPGQEVMLRSVLFRRTDLAPLDGRPGTWTITDPNGQQMLVEKGKAGSYGVAATSFPLDARATVGTWTATWASGGATDAVHFDVRPFRLPRFTVELTPSATWYRIGDTLVVDGVARYSSGAPVPNAPVTVNVSVASGRWPEPLEWEQPYAAKTDAHGKFRVTIGQVPPDLIERATLDAHATVTEAAGEAAQADASLVLSQYDLQVDAVTELGDGLVEGFNNRVYLRVTSPDGSPVRKAKVAVTPWWDEKAKPIEGESDEDGVAALQIDPGKPVTVVIPAPPWRPRPLTPSVPTVTRAYAASGDSADLELRWAFDLITPAIAACGDLTTGTEVSLGVQVDASGAVRRVMTGASDVEQCVADAMKRVRFPSDGAPDTWSIGWQVPDSLRPSLNPSSTTIYGSADVDAAFAAASYRARRCLPVGAGVSGEEALVAHWTVDVGAKAPQVVWGDGEGAGLSPSQLACARQAVSTARFDAPATSQAMGTTTFTLSVPSASGSPPQDQTKTGYQLRVAAVTDGARVGEAPLILDPGTVPPLRIRATPTLAKAGDTVTYKLIRGPGWSGDLPEELTVYEGTAKVADVKLDKDKHEGTLVVPDGTDGFLQMQYSGARSIVYVEPAAKLSVALSTDKTKYRPGDEAKILVKTTSGSQPTKAGVGLVGVDSTLGQLAALTGPDEYGRVTVRVTADQPAFGAFDPKALILGQISGQNAAAAAVLRITNLPQDAAGDDRLYNDVRSVDHDAEQLQASFYRALGALGEKESAWEASAPQGDLMTNDRMVAMWSEVLADLRKSGEPATDAFGRELTLDVLPPDLLAQTDPRAVVGDATRLPEDVVDWNQYVATEVR